MSSGEDNYKRKKERVFIPSMIKTWSIWPDQSDQKFQRLYESLSWQEIFYITVEFAFKTSQEKGS